MEKLIKANYIITDGSSFSGIYLIVGLSKLIELLGKPTTIGSGDDKTQLQWTFYDKTGDTVITIYDYREDKPIHKINEWHIGTRNISDKSEIIYNLNELGFDKTKMIKVRNCCWYVNQ